MRRVELRKTQVDSWWIYINQVILGGHIMTSKTLKILNKGKCDTDIEDVRLNITPELAALMLELNTDNPRTLNKSN